MKNLILNNLVKMKKYTLFLAIFLITLNACVPKKEVIYMQNAKNSKITKIDEYSTVIKPDDLLLIQIQTSGSTNNEIVDVFNLTTSLVSNVPNLARPANTYLVDSDGFITLPTLGMIYVQSMKKRELVDMLYDKAKLIVKNPIINVRILNFKISVNGEVQKPGVYNVETERITLLEALTLAGDLTIFGKRKNILIIRESDNKPIFKYVDITNTDFINSEFYYLQQNDVIHVEARKSKIDSTTFGSNVTTLVTISSFVLTTLLLLTR